MLTLSFRKADVLTDTSLSNSRFGIFGVGATAKARISAGFLSGGMDGARTRDLLRDRQAL